MNEFSPGVLEMTIRPLLQRVAENQGNREALCRDIAKIGRLSKTVGKQQLNRANNVLIGLSECRLFNLHDNKLTPLGLDILGAPSDLAASESFARHILHKLHGLRLIEIVERARLDGTPITLDLIREGLKADGFEVTTNEGNASKMRLWLQDAGVIDRNWTVNQQRLALLTGMTTSTLNEADSLTDQQRTFLNRLRVAALVEPEGAWLKLGPIKDQIDLEFGSGFLHGGTLRSKVIGPLEEGGWLVTRGTGRGRGGKIGEAMPTGKLMALADTLPFGSPLGIPPELRDKLKRPVATVLGDLTSPDKHVKGIALEVLSVRLLVDLGLRPVGFRTRAREADFAEADLIADGVYLHHSRWIVQCKNTPIVSQAHLIREIGLAEVLRANVVLLVTTGRFAKGVGTLARQVARDSHLQIVTLDGGALKRYSDAGVTALRDEVKLQAEEALRFRSLGPTAVVMPE